MRIAEVEKYVKSLVPHLYYAYSYPTNAKDECALLILEGGLPTENTGVRRPSLQILVRGNVDDTSGAEAKAYELYEALKYREDFMIGETSVTKMQALQSAPLWTGKDEAKRPIFSLNFTITIRR
ncbi:minor capsid protein [Bacillus cereus]|nr:minor capsid protein [Bacillus cereus]